MTNRFKVFWAVFLLAFMPISSMANSLSTEQKVQLQAAMYQHIEANLTDGVITHINLQSGDTVDLVPSKAHAMILSFEENYVLCVDFINPLGNAIDVDFYIKPEDDTYRVFRMEIDNRKPLKKLMSQGRVTRVQ